MKSGDGSLDGSTVDESEVGDVIYPHPEDAIRHMDVVFSVPLTENGFNLELRAIDGMIIHKLLDGNTPSLCFICAFPSLVSYSFLIPLLLDRLYSLQDVTKSSGQLVLPQRL